MPPHDLDHETSESCTRGKENGGRTNAASFSHTHYLDRLSTNTVVVRRYSNAMKACVSRKVGGKI